MAQTKSDITQLMQTAIERVQQRPTSQLLVNATSPHNMITK